MTAAGITDAFVDRLAKRAQEAEELRRLPADTVAEIIASGFTELLKPARYGGQQAEFRAILDPVRRMAHGCASSGVDAWLLCAAQLDAGAVRRAGPGRGVRDAAASSRRRRLAPTGRGVPVDGGVRLSGRWSWATGVMDGNWVDRRGAVRPGRRDLPGARAAARRSTSRSWTSGTPTACGPPAPTTSSSRTLSCLPTGSSRSSTSTAAPHRAPLLHDADALPLADGARTRRWSRRCRRSARPSVSPRSTPRG